MKRYLNKVTKYEREDNVTKITTIDKITGTVIGSTLIRKDGDTLYKECIKSSKHNLLRKLKINTTIVNSNGIKLINTLTSRIYKDQIESVSSKLVVRKLNEQFKDRIDHQIIQEDGKIVSEILNKRNAKGELVNCKEFRPYTVNNTDYYYDKNGKFIKSISVIRNRKTEEIKSTNVMNRDSDTELTVVKENKDGTKRTKKIIVTEIAGMKDLPVEIYLLFDNGTKEYLYKNEYDEKGNLIKTTSFEDMVEKEYVYDDDNRFVDIKEYILSRYDEEI